jgi:hypothetical protein
MIAIYLPLAVAEEVARRCSDLPMLVEQIEAQRAIEKTLPTDALPVLALWYPDAQYSEQIYDARLAHALWMAYTRLVIDERLPRRAPTAKATTRPRREKTSRG